MIIKWINEYYYYLDNNFFKSCNLPYHINNYVSNPINYMIVCILYNVNIDPERIIIMPGGKPTMHYAISFFGEVGAEILYPEFHEILIVQSSVEFR